MLSLQNPTVFYVSIVLIIVTGSVSSDEIRRKRFVERSTGGIALDNVDSVLSRLRQISKRTSSKISDIRAVQQEEFKKNSLYKDGWNIAARAFSGSKGQEIFNITPDAIVRSVPEEYHIALIAYSMKDSTMYEVFNLNTREIRSETDIDNYQWKSYFKLLQLAIEELGSKVGKWKPSNFKVLYRGAKVKFDLKENQVLAFQQYTSTSGNPEIAKEYAKNVTLFEFHGIYDGAAMNIRNHSVYTHEAEILFSPAQTFRVIGVYPGSPEKYVLVSSSVLVYANCLLVIKMSLFVSLSTMWRS